MLNNVIIPIFKSVTACAVIIPGIDGLAEFIGTSAGLRVNPLNGNGDLIAASAKLIPEGFSRTIADIAIAAQQFIGHTAELSANIGNVIGVNHLAGVKALNADDFTEKGGIIVKVMQNFFQYLHLLPETATHALDEKNRGVLLTGAAVALGGTALLAPELGQELRNDAVSVTTRVGQLGQRAMSSAQTAGSGFADKIRNQQASLTSSIHSPK